MEISIIVMTVVGISTSLISFLLGIIYGRNTAYKTIDTYQTADTLDGRLSLGDRYGIRSNYGHTYKKGSRRGGEGGQGLADE